jgi:hypothetical protein
MNSRLKKGSLIQEEGITTYIPTFKSLVWMVSRMAVFYHKRVPHRSMYPAPCRIINWLKVLRGQGLFLGMKTVSCFLWFYKRETEVMKIRINK